MNEMDNIGVTALMLALNVGAKDTADLLRRSGAIDTLSYEDTQRRCSDSKMIELSKNGEIVSIQDCLRRSGNSNAKDNKGVTALMFMSYRSHVPAAEILIKSGANVNAKDDDGTTALMAASMKGHIYAVEALIRAGVKVNAMDKNGMSALAFAIDNGHVSVVDVLRRQGAKDDHKIHMKANCTDEEMLSYSKGTCSVMGMFFCEDDWVKVQECIDGNSNVNAVGASDYSALMIASGQGHSSIATALIDGGANVNAKNKNGGTALILASAKGHEVVVMALIKAGADVHAKDSLGMTASLWASLRLRTGTEDLLRLSGCTEAISSIVIYFFTVLLALLIYFTIMWVSFKG